MSYIVFARKYRPQSFDDVVGQSHITTTLKNAIEQSRVAHAYLFAGPRGVGKTTTARVLAKALNCEKGPKSEPCNNCDSCKEITQGSSLDILEIDGASNRGIEEIRSLRDNVKFAPSKGKFKVYIIDEVHMLSADAFNALLKTLEEPPPHVIFIFATTNPHKVPATVLSRCQRFDFRRLATKDILANLKKIAKEEKLNVKDEALSLIAKYGDGSMRDGQVILDQISSFSQGKVGIEDVTKILGIVDDEILFGLSNAISNKDSKGALLIIDRLINDGKDAIQVVLGLIEHFRNISVAKISSDLSSIIDASPEKATQYATEAETFTIEEILYVIYTLSNTIDFIRKSSLARIPFEAAVVKLTQPGSIVSLAEIMKRIDALGASSSRAGSSKESSRPIEDKSRDGQVISDKPQARAVETLKEDNNAAAPEETGEPKAQTAVSTEEPKAALAGADLDEILAAWAKVINQVKTKKISIGSYLQEGYPIDVESHKLFIGFPKELQFHKEVLESLENRRLIEEAIDAVMGKPLRVVFKLIEPVGMPKSDGSSYPDGADGADGDDKADAADPIIKSALEMFGGQVARARDDKRTSR